MALITCKELSIGYDGKAILQNINFSVAPGDYLCIVGENGSGKSTLMRTILGLQQPLSGEIRFGDGLGKKEVGYLPQQTQVQKDFPASVREIVLSGCQNRCGLRPFYRKEEKEHARKTMEKLGIANLSGRSYRELSGGQQQRVLLARALCATKKILLLDEPVSGLDPKAAEEMYTIVRNLNRKEGVAVLMISHDIQAAAADATHILQIGETASYMSQETFLKKDGVCNA